jgi:hypothetical protein
MKYLQSFFESSRFSHLQGVITEIKELSLFLKDEGFEISFGIMPTGLSMPNYANFDDQGSGTNLGDIQLKMISTGKMVSFYKIDLSSPLQPGEPYEILFTTGTKYRDNCLNDEQKEMVCDVVLSVVDLFRREGIVIVGFWYKSSEEQRHLDRFFRTNFSFVDLEKLLDAIKIGIALDIRIAFTGQKLLKESSGPELEMSDLLNIEEIVRDYNDELEDVVISMAYLDDDKNLANILIYEAGDSYRDSRGFELGYIKEFLLRIMSELDLDQINLRILYQDEQFRRDTMISKDYLMFGMSVSDLISSIVITFEHNGV